MPSKPRIKAQVRRHDNPDEKCGLQCFSLPRYQIDWVKETARDEGLSFSRLMQEIIDEVIRIQAEKQLQKDSEKYREKEESPSNGGPSNGGPQ